MPPQVDISCETLMMGNEDVKCRIEMSEEVVGTINECIEMDENGIVVNWHVVTGRLHHSPQCLLLSTRC